MGYSIENGVPALAEAPGNMQRGDGMPTMTVDYRVVLLVLGLLCLLVGVVLLVRLLLKRRPYTATVTARLVDYEDVYETTKEGTQTISQRVFYPIFVYEVDGVSYKKSTSKQFFEQD